MTYEQVKKLYADWQTSINARPKILVFGGITFKAPVNHDFIIDENESVKWNKESVQKINDHFKSERSRIAAECSDKKDAFVAALDKYLIETKGRGKLTKGRLQLIKNFMYDHHEDAYYFYEGLDRFIDLANELIDIVVADVED